MTSGSTKQSPEERQFNLFVALMVANRYLKKSEIRDQIEGYKKLSDDAFDRQFERDKKDLIELGIRIDVGSTEADTDDRNGYRIHRSEIELPDIMFTPEEVALLGVAGRVWDKGGYAADILSAISKLETAVGVKPADDRVFFSEPRLSNSDPELETVWEALRDREVLEFAYTDRQGNNTNRKVEVWHLFSHEGGWYIAARDTVKDEARVFKLSRMKKIKTVGKPASYEIPTDIDLSSLTAFMFKDLPIQSARIKLRRGSGVALRQKALSERKIDDEFDEVEIAYHWIESVIASIAELGAQAEVISPPEVRAGVINRLKRVLGEK